MAQTFGMGRYVPPELEGTVSHNQASGKGHALGARARKLKSEGILIVRFECPFAIWCTNCQPEQIIGQGVRFNAEKKKVGDYYSTPIWSFRIKHTVCGKWLEIRTDPKNAEYVVVEGGRRRDHGRTTDSLLEDGFRIGTGASEEEREALEKEGGFAALEKKVQDKREHDSQTKRIDELSKMSNRDWEDPYELSRKLRREFRVGRRQRQADERSGEALKDRYGIHLDLVAPIPEDEQRSKLVTFGEIKASNTASRGMFDKITSKQSSSTAIQSSKGENKKGRKEEAVVVAPRKLDLQSSLQGNTRHTADPFLRENQGWKPRAKRKRSMSEVNNNDDVDPQPDTSMPASPAHAVTMALVGYDSDSNSS